jgi:PAS domain-containing protein
MLTTALGVQRAYWGETDWQQRQYVVDVVVPAEDRDAYRGRYPIDGWEPFTSRYLAGLTVVREDTTAFAHLPAEQRTASVPPGHVASISVPVLVDGTLRAILGVSQSSPRCWTPPEIELAEALATRAWAEVERTRTETALRDSERLMRLAVRATGLVTWEWIPTEDRITTSDSFAIAYGLPAPSSAEQAWALVQPEDAEQHLAKVRAIVADGGAYTSAFRIRRPDGRLVHLKERAEAQTAPDGTVERVIGLTVDITHRDTDPPSP